MTCRIIAGVFTFSAKSGRTDMMSRGSSVLFGARLAWYAAQDSRRGKVIMYNYLALKKPQDVYGRYYKSKTTMTIHNEVIRK
tara:strand:- start:267 stop:512 length:246 start_codon:yes stop_codon:yes gene_type:complete